jgi:hypothetical protein
MRFYTMCSRTLSSDGKYIARETNEPRPPSRQVLSSINPLPSQLPLNPSFPNHGIFSKSYKSINCYASQSNTKGGGSPTGKYRNPTNPTIPA